MSLPLLFAPLQGYTDHVYRTLHARFAGGIDTYCTPFIRWEKGDVRNKDVRDILPENNEGIHLLPQIICAKPEEFNALCDMIQTQAYGEIDINMGCPAPMQTKLHRGSGILPHPADVEALLREMERRPDVRFSVKMRLGLETADEWQALLPLLNDSCISHITLHPRVGRQMYKGEVDMDAFAAFYAACRKPLIYNGDLSTLDEIHRIQEQFPHLNGLMIGRGLLARPTLAAEYAEGKEWTEERRLQVILDMHEGMLAHCREKYVADSQVLLHMHTFWEYMEPTLGRKPWKKLMKAGSMRNYLDALQNLL